MSLVWQWSASVDRQLLEREKHLQERRIEDLLHIVTEMEERCRVVVNREMPALQGVPSWKDKPAAKKPMFLRRMSNTQIRRRREWELASGTRKSKQREEEFEGVLLGKHVAELAAAEEQQKSSEEGQS